VRRGLPSKGEARALHHQPDLDHALLLLSSKFLAVRQVEKQLKTLEKSKLTKTKEEIK
jgi:hypothetical protein